MKNHARAMKSRPSRYRPTAVDQALRTEPGVVLAEVLRRAGGAYETTTRLTPKSRADIREIAELTSDDELLAVAERPEVPVSLEHLRHLDPQTRIVVGYRLDVTPAESPRLRRRMALPPDPGITLHFDEVVFPGTPDVFWAATRIEESGSLVRRCLSSLRQPWVHPQWQQAAGGPNWPRRTRQKSSVATRGRLRRPARSG
jgi:hypothetical protein